MFSETPTPTKTRGKPSVITPQRKQLILNFIHEYRRVRKISPTVKDIAQGIGYLRESAGTVHSLINELIEEGWLERVQPGARTLFPTLPPDAEYAPITDPELKRIARQQRNLHILRRL